MEAINHRFGRFELQPGERRLLADGQPVALGGRALDLLLALVQRAGSLVTKSELLEAAWPGLVVEEGNITTQVCGLRKVLGDDVIATIPGRGYRFTAPVDTPTATPPPIAPPTPLRAPAGPPLFGREADLAQLLEALRRPGCVSLVGAAGVGKTRLAQAAAAGWPGPSTWVDLAPLTHNDELLPALARALAIPAPEGDPAPALQRALKAPATLLVLDNAEHRIDGVARLAALLQHALPALHLLVTSQVPLAVPGERVHRLEPLAPSAAAVALFVHAAGAADHRFRPGPEAGPLLQEICTRLDGLPLALEMAAARVPALGLQGLRDALERRFALLTTGRRVADPRHRTLQAALDWSHGLLNAGEQRLFRRLGVFAGGFTLDLAATLAADEAHDRWDVIDTLATLVDRSLVATDRADVPRYRLLETMRAYALERLAEAGEEAAVRQRHAELMQGLLERAAAQSFGGAAQQAALAEHDNLRDAIAWARSAAPPLALALSRLAALAATFSSWRREAVGWLEDCSTAVDDPAVAPGLRAQWWIERSRQAVMGQDARAPALARRAREICVALGDDAGLFKATSTLVRSLHEPSEELDTLCAEMQTLLARHPEWHPSMRVQATGVLAHACELRSDWPGLLAQREAELALARAAGAHDWADAAETNVLVVLTRLGRGDEAVARAERLLARLGDADTGNAAYAWEEYVATLIELGRFAEARAHAPRALQVLRRHDLPILSDPLALMAALEGRPRGAAQLIGYARAAYAVRGLALQRCVHENLARAAALACRELDAASFEALVARGGELDDAAAERLAFAIDDTD